MKTKKLYYDDAYITKFEATVLSCEQSTDGYLVILDRTAFFPEEGGQYADRGMIGGIKVTDAKERDGVIIHKATSPIDVGAIVDCEINFDERYEKMQCHTGEHIVSGIVRERFGFNNVGFHLGYDDVTIDYDGVITDDELHEIELEANRAIYKNIEVKCEFPSDEILKSLDYRSKLELTENIRIVTIDGYDVCACCAPHVKRTGEVGIIKFLDKISYKGGVRIHMLCGFRALADYNARYIATKNISSLLSVKQDNVISGVERVLSETESLKAQLSAIKRNILAEKISELRETPENIIVFEEILDAGYMREFINNAVKYTTGFAGAFIKKDAESYTYIIGSKTIDLKVISESLKASLGARGGGSSEMITGNVSKSKEEILEFINKK